jgi:hypothetical protein
MVCSLPHCRGIDVVVILAMSALISLYVSPCFFPEGRGVASVLANATELVSSDPTVTPERPNDTAEDQQHPGRGPWILSTRSRTASPKFYGPPSPC